MDETALGQFNKPVSEAARVLCGMALAIAMLDVGIPGVVILGDTGINFEGAFLVAVHVRRAGSTC